jgi:hypothetical protein
MAQSSVLLTPVDPLGDEAAARTTREFQRVGHNVYKGFRLRTRHGDVDQCCDRSEQCLQTRRLDVKSVTGGLSELSKIAFSLEFVVVNSGFKFKRN